ncbi:MAG: hypothetical protein PHQ75_07230 [Thermoguttaceae bacterium]|nr:hypothetical protein [Thermoguttaceae bacterium]
MLYGLKVSVWQRQTEIAAGKVLAGFISSWPTTEYNELNTDDDDVEDKVAYTEKNIFFVSRSVRWKVITEAVHKEEVGTVIDNVMRAIEKENKKR